jgi:hypothetical protein
VPRQAIDQRSLQGQICPVQFEHSSFSTVVHVGYGVVEIMKGLGVTIAFALLLILLFRFLRDSVIEEMTRGIGGIGAIGKSV